MFFLPLFDDNPTRRPPLLCWCIIAICVCVFLWQQSLPYGLAQTPIYQLGFIPGRFFGYGELPPQLAVVPSWVTIGTSMFLHGGWMHLGSNMLYLWIFGDNIEDSMGRVRFILFYALCGIAAAMAQASIDPTSSIPMIGASGGIAGILGAYLILHPKAAIRTFFFILIIVRFINIPAWIVLGVWIGGQFFAVPQALESEGGGVAYFAHIGGFIAGMALVPFFKRKDVPLFGAHDTPPPHKFTEPVRFSQIKAEARYRYGRKQNDPLGSRILAKDTPKPPSGAKRSGSVPQRKRGPWG